MFGHYITDHVMTYKLLELGHDAQNSSATVDASWTIKQLDVELHRGRYVHPYNATPLDVEWSCVELSCYAINWA